MEGEKVSRLLGDLPVADFEIGSSDEVSHSRASKGPVLAPFLQHGEAWERGLSQTLAGESLATRD